MSRPDNIDVTQVRRYTDFLVNEILPSGKVVHLENLKPPKRQRKQEEKPTESEPAPVENAKTEDTNGDTRMVDAEGQAANTNTNGGEKEADAPAQISSADKATLAAIFDDKTLTSIIALHTAILDSPQASRKTLHLVTSLALTSKDTRTTAHQALRKIFDSKLESVTNADETLNIFPAPPAQKQRGGNVANNGNQQRGRGKMSWEELGGEYLHFTLYKENKDTMEAVFFLASQLKVGPKAFQFSGTKDRRGVTVQRCSAYRVHAEQMAALGRQLRGSKVGDYEYSRYGLELGELGGNEFVITLRDCHFPGEEGMEFEQRLELAKKTVDQTTTSFASGGFLNYYGLQRFGSFATSTDAVGTKLLQGNFKAAVDAILSYEPATLAAAFADPPERLPPNATMPSLPSDVAAIAKPETLPAPGLISSDDRLRALALYVWETKQDTSAALALLPRKFSAEMNLIRHLGQRHRKTGEYQSMTDYQGALSMIPRNLRLMYVHAYQSLVWNTIAGSRWAQHGSTVVEGDLVLVEPEVEAEGSANGTVQGIDATGAGYKQTVDENGEAVILPAVAPSQTNLGIHGKGKSDDYQRARPLSADEAASGKYNIFDIVLPLPGFDVVYPPNTIGEEYKTFMASEAGGGLDPGDMRRSWKDMSLSGGYRKVLGRPEGVVAEVRGYVGEEQMVETDLERLEGRGAGGKGGAGETKSGAGTADKDMKDGGDDVPEEKRIAVVLRMRLAPSMYATMALRELMKEAGVRTYKPDYGAGAR